MCEPNDCYLLTRNKGQQSNMTRALDGSRQQTLVLGAGTCAAARRNGPAARDKLLQHARILVVNAGDLIDAELTHAAAATLASAAPGAASRTTITAVATLTAITGITGSVSGIL